MDRAGVCLRFVSVLVTGVVGFVVALAAYTPVQAQNRDVERIELGPSWESVLSREQIGGFVAIFEETGYGFSRIERITNISNQSVRLDSIQFIYLDPADVGIPNMDFDNTDDIYAAARTMYPEFYLWGGNWYGRLDPEDFPDYSYDCFDPADPFLNGLDNGYVDFCGEADTVTWTNITTPVDLKGKVLLPGEYIDVPHTAINDIPPEYIVVEGVPLFISVHSELVVGFRIEGEIGGEPPPSAKKPYVVFLPGFAGSRLYTDGAVGDNTLWLPNREEDVCRLRPDDNGWSFGVYNKPESDGGLLRTASLIDGVGYPAPADVYGDFLDFLDDLKDRGIIGGWQAFPYDWRDDVRYIATLGGVTYGASGSTNTINLVSAIKQLAGDHPVTLIGHSNGGLLAKALAAVLADDLGPGNLRVITVGTPHLGTPQAIAGLLHGEFAEKLDRLKIGEGVKREAAETMVGAYTQLPTAKLMDENNSFIQFWANKPGQYEPIPLLRWARDVSSLPDSFTVPGIVPAIKLVRSYDDLRAFLLAEEDGRGEPFPGANDCFNLNFKTDTSQPNRLRQNILQQSESVHQVLDDPGFLGSIPLVQIAGWGIDSTPRSVVYKHCIPGLPDCTPSTLEHFIGTTCRGDGTVVHQSASGMPAPTFYVDLGEYNRTLPALPPACWPASTPDELRSHMGLMGAYPVRCLIEMLLQDEPQPEARIPLVTRTEPSRSCNSIVATVYSPVTLHAYDSEGRHTGLAASPDSESSEQAILEEQIPNSSLRRVSGHMTLHLDTADEYQLVLEGTGPGTFSLVLEEFEGDQVVATRMFANVPVTEKTVAELSVRSAEETGDLEIDFDGDGSIDAIFRAGEEPDAASSLQGLIDLIRTMDMPRITRLALIAEIRLAIRALERDRLRAARIALSGFIGTVRFLSGRKISEEDAEGLKQIALQIKTTI